MAAEHGKLIKNEVLVHNLIKFPLFYFFTKAFVKESSRILQYHIYHCRANLLHTFIFAVTALTLAFILLGLH